MHILWCSWNNPLQQIESKKMTENSPSHALIFITCLSTSKNFLLWQRNPELKNVLFINFFKMFNIFLQFFNSLRNSTLKETRTRTLNKFYSYILQGVAHFFSLKNWENLQLPLPIPCRMPFICVSSWQRRRIKKT